MPHIVKAVLELAGQARPAGAQHTTLGLLTPVHADHALAVSSDPGSGSVSRSGPLAGDSPGRAESEAPDVRFGSPARGEGNQRHGYPEAEAAPKGLARHVSLRLTALLAAVAVASMGLFLAARLLTPSAVEYSGDDTGRLVFVASLVTPEANTLGSVAIRDRDGSAALTVILHDLRPGAIYTSAPPDRETPSAAGRYRRARAGAV